MPFWTFFYGLSGGDEFLSNIDFPQWKKNVAIKITVKPHFNVSQWHCIKNPDFITAWFQLLILSPRQLRMYFPLKSHPHLFFFYCRCPSCVTIRDLKTVALKWKFLYGVFTFLSNDLGIPTVLTRATLLTTLALIVACWASVGTTLNGMRCQ